MFHRNSLTEAYLGRLAAEDVLYFGHITAISRRIFERARVRLWNCPLDRGITVEISAIIMGQIENIQPKLESNMRRPGLIHDLDDPEQ